MFWNKFNCYVGKNVYSRESQECLSGWKCHQSLDQLGVNNKWGNFNYGEHSLKSVHIEFVTIGSGPLSCKNNFFLPIKRYITAKFNQFPSSLACLQQLKLSPTLTHSFFLHLWPSCVAASSLIEKGIAECVTAQLVSDCIKESYWA